MTPRAATAKPLIVAIVSRAVRDWKDAERRNVSLTTAHYRDTRRIDHDCQPRDVAGLAMFFNSPTVARLLDEIEFPTDLRTIRAKLHIPDLASPRGLSERSLSQDRCD